MRVRLRLMWLWVFRLFYRFFSGWIFSVVGVRLSCGM